MFKKHRFKFRLLFSLRNFMIGISIEKTSTVRHIFFHFLPTLTLHLEVKKILTRRSGPRKSRSQASPVTEAVA